MYSIMLFIYDYMNIMMIIILVGMFNKCYEMLNESECLVINYALGLFNYWILLCCNYNSI